jgi:phage terminase large subunit-like protein
MVIKKENINPIIEYNNQIQDGKIVTCNKIKILYAHIVECITNKESAYYYDGKRANHAIQFIEKFCRHSKGKWGGKLVKLELWQKAFICTLFGVLRKSTNKRRFKEAILLIGRKNGKSLLASAISIYMMIADSEAGAECYAVATKRDQAKIIWQEAQSMVKKSPFLLSVIKCRTNELKCDRFDSTFKPLSSESNTLDGLNTHYAGMDEVHAWKDKNLYDVIIDSTSAREEPIVLSLSTMGYVREGIFDILYDMATRCLMSIKDGNRFNDNFLPVVYELDKREEYSNPDCWIKANPNLGVSKSYDYMQNAYNKVLDDPRRLANFLTKDCNIKETVAEAFFTFDEINNEETFDFEEIKPVYYCGGFDLSETTDLTSACALFELPDRIGTLFIEQMYWLPYDLLEQRVKEDNIPYDVWYKQGLLRLSNGNKINTEDVEEWFRELAMKYQFYPSFIGYDRWCAREVVNNMKTVFGAPCMYEVKQYAKVLSNPLKMLANDFKAGKIVYNNNPITKWCLTNLAVKTDVNGNIQPVKAVHQTRRIDGAMTILDAYIAYIDNKEEYRNANGIK